MKWFLVARDRVFCFCIAFCQPPAPLVAARKKPRAEESPIRAVSTIVEITTTTGPL